MSYNTKRTVPIVARCRLPFSGDKNSASPTDAVGIIVIHTLKLLWVWIQPKPASQRYRAYSYYNTEKPPIDMSKHRVQNRLTNVSLSTLMCILSAIQVNELRVCYSFGLRWWISSLQWPTQLLTVLVLESSLTPFPPLWIPAMSMFLPLIHRYASVTSLALLADGYYCGCLQTFWEKEIVNQFVCLSLWKSLRISWLCVALCIDSIWRLTFCTGLAVV